MFGFGPRVSGLLFPCSSTRTGKTRTRASAPPSVRSSVRPDSVPHHLDSESGINPEGKEWRPISKQP